MPLLDKPKAEEIRAYRDANECGVEEAKMALHQEWVKRNLLAVVKKLGEAKGAAQAAHPAVPQLADAMLQLCELILEEVEQL